MDTRLRAFLEGNFKKDLSGLDDELLFTLVRNAFVEYEHKIANLQLRVATLERAETQLQAVKRPLYAALTAASALFASHSPVRKIADGLRDGAAEKPAEGETLTTTTWPWGEPPSDLSDVRQREIAAERRQHE